MLKQRILTVAVVLPLLLACMFLLPNAGWALLITIPAALGALEWSKLAGHTRTARGAFIAAVVATCLLFVGVSRSAELSARAAGLASWLYVLALLFWAAAAPAWLYCKWRVQHPLVLGFTGWIVLIPSWLAVVALQKSPWLLLIVLGAVWMADTAAYFAGKCFGRHKLAPQISPGKTWEGVLGAYVAVIVYGTVVGLLLQSPANVYDRLAVLLFVCVLTAFGIIGDLFESWIKRQAGAKDSGRLLPGHGGVLDRIDSLTAALPFAALYFLRTGW